MTPATPPQAQVSTTVTPPSLLHGQPAAITLTLTNGPQPIAGLQFSVTVPPDWTIGTPMLTPATAVIPKFLDTTQPSSTTVFCLIFGLNVSSIPDGPFIIIPITGPIRTPPGDFPIELSGLVASSPAGVQVPITGTGATVTLERHHWWRRNRRKKK